MRLAMDFLNVLLCDHLFLILSFYYNFELFFIELGHKND